MDIMKGSIMVNYKCKKCNQPTETSECPVCHERTYGESKLFWCSECNIPLYEEKCMICGKQSEYIATDLRPVFPEERLLMEIVLGKPFAFVKESVWNSKGIYFVNGKKVTFTLKNLRNVNTENIRKQYIEFSSDNTYEYFGSMISSFVFANSIRYNEIVNEAVHYIQKISAPNDTSNMFVSFSGGKDSTVVSDLVMKALSNPQILHIFGDTTLEFPETLDYVTRFKDEHKKTPVISSKNKDKDFLELCEQIGPPSRILRWCCTIFKTGAITRKITSLLGDKKNILTFYGIRRNESTSRSKYDREADSPKITKQIVVSPIIDWYDFDIWLYLLTTNIDFNNAYRLGYARVGCWCCPNNSGWSEFLSKIYMPDQYNKFRNVLVNFAKTVNKLDPEEYVDSGSWKARQGGNGLNIARRSIISFEPCANEENAFNYELQKPITKGFYELFKPFGYINKELGNKRLGEVYVLDKNGNAVIKLQGRLGCTHLKVTIYKKNLAGAKSLLVAEGKIKCQITKYQMCMECRACEGVCKHNAISVKRTENGDIIYTIDDNKCVRCGECVGHFDAGCYMRKVLAIKRG